MSVCLFVLYAFRSCKSRRQTLQRISFGPEEGRGVVFDPKFPTRRGGCPLLFELLFPRLKEGITEKIKMRLFVSDQRSKKHRF